ncbi:MAG: hypothetical protein EBT13_01985, partial [Rhodobacteraceae bacterium]|nr:hypothetical protein [Paracoccaceae bacterium]
TLASVKDGWVRECRKWLPHVDCYLYEGRTGKPRYFPAENPPEDGTRPALHVCNYDIIPHRVQELESIDFQAVIYDEGHLLKNKKSKRTQAATMIGHRKPVRLVLTGTPVENRPAELMTVLGLLGRMNDVGGFQYFTHHYLGAQRKKVGKEKYIWTFGKPKHLPELHEKMRATFYLRRLCKDVDKERPASIITRVPITLPPAGKAAYDAAKADIKAWLAAKAPLRPEEAKRIEAAPAELREFVRGQVITEAAERLDGSGVSCSQTSSPRAPGWMACNTRLHTLSARNGRGRRQSCVRPWRDWSARDRSTPFINGIFTSPAPWTTRASNYSPTKPKTATR